MNNLQEIINKLKSNAYPEFTYVGKEYTKADLITHWIPLPSPPQGE